MYSCPNPITHLMWTQSQYYKKKPIKNTVYDKSKILPCSFNVSAEIGISLQLLVHTMTYRRGHCKLQIQHVFYLLNVKDGSFKGCISRISPYHILPHHYTGPSPFLDACVYLGRSQITYNPIHTQKTESQWSIKVAIVSHSRHIHNHHNSDPPHLYAVIATVVKGFQITTKFMCCHCC